MLFEHSWSTSAVRGAESAKSREEGEQPLERDEEEEALLCGGLFTRLETSTVTEVRPDCMFHLFDC